MVLVLFEDLRQTKKLNGLHPKRNYDRVNGETKKPELGGSGFELKQDSGDESGHSRHFTTSTISDSPNFYNKEIGESMENLGYFIIPRSITSDPRYQGARLKYKHVLHILLEHAAFRKTKYAIGTNLIDIEIGQFCVSVRGLIDLCNKGIKFKEDKVDKNTIERASHFWSTCGFVRQEVRHGKTILTITIPEVYIKEKQEGETASETKVRLNRDTNEERKEELRSLCLKETLGDADSFLLEKNKKEEIKKSYTPNQGDSNQETIFKIPESQIKDDLMVSLIFIEENKIPLDEKDVEKWIRKWGGFCVISNLQLMTKQKKVIKNPSGWMQTALRDDWAKNKKNQPINRKYAEDFKKKNSWSDLMILKEYCTIRGTSYDIQFKLDPETFIEIIRSKYENLYRGYDKEPNY